MLRGGDVEPGPRRPSCGRRRLDTGAVAGWGGVGVQLVGSHPFSLTVVWSAAGKTDRVHECRRHRRAGRAGQPPWRKYRARRAVAGSSDRCATLSGVAHQPPILLIDAPSLYFRAYFGVPESAARATDGTPVNAVRGFLDMLATLVRTRRPDRMVCALDHDWRPDWRVALLPSYKAHRVAPEGGEEVPDTLTPQVPVILDVLAAIGITAVGAAGYEADDVLGTLSVTQPAPAGGRLRRPGPVPTRRRRARG
ncbi:LOW QUALITY PROTEIN: 5'-3' exonuclease, partial [Micromonospora sp. ATCC 39149]